MEIFSYEHLESLEVDNAKLKECTAIAIDFVRARSYGATLRKLSKVGGRRHK